jgi:hypothetical protein
MQIVALAVDETLGVAQIGQGAMQDRRRPAAAAAITALERAVHDVECLPVQGIVSCVHQPPLL